MNQRSNQQIYDKTQLRERMKQMRKSLTHADIAEKSRRMYSALTSLEEYKRSECICVYMASFNEPRTDIIINDAFASGKRVCIPVTDIDSGTLSLSYITAETSFVKGAYGISEPDSYVKADMSESDLIIVPGIAFDASGNRIGFGKGFYDKLLSESSAVRIGLCYSFQICGCIVPDEHDIPMDVIITEEMTTRCI